MSKLSLNIFAGLFIGITFFKAHNSIRGSQNELFAIFMATILSNSLVQFVNSRNITGTAKGEAICIHRRLWWLSLLVELEFNIFGSVFFWSAGTGPWDSTMGALNTFNGVLQSYVQFILSSK
ncbi:hypothetical protein BDV93DRAFT_605114 [Ceratobasidium sp. AG-I]|nr:hypothetical protein BDV93DRAFT_605114 [Ceratobasidium sp. AG-I]